jgi:hypothetical protein
MRRQEIKGKNCTKNPDTGDFLSTFMHNGGGGGGDGKSKKRT